MKLTAKQKNDLRITIDGILTQLELGDMEFDQALDAIMIEIENT